MRQPVENFIRALRASDVRVSVAEAIDAHNVMAQIGFDDRNLLRSSLRLTMAKSIDEKHRFDEVFDLFFARDQFQINLSGDQDGEDGEGGESSAQAGDGEPGDGGGEGGDQPTDNALANALLNGDGQALARQMEQAANQVGAGNIRYFTQRGYFSRRILDQMGLAELEQLIARMNRGELDADEATIERLGAGRQRLFEEARNFMDRQFELYARSAGEELREEFLQVTRLSAISPRDFERMHRIVHRMARKLASRYVRRRKTAKRGTLDIRRTMRANMGHDGVPFLTYWKQTKIDRPKLVVICDVSQSVAAAARFLLLFVYALNEVVRDIHSFAFSSHAMEISGIVEDHDVEDAIPKVMEAIGFRSTDYGQMLQDLNEDYLDLFDRHTTVMILGDARSNYGEARADIMKKIYDRSRRVIWINPEPQSFWGLGDSEMKNYRPYCHVAASCNTLKQLERILDNMLKSVMRV